MTPEQEHQYEICQERGHAPSGEYQTWGDEATWSICKWCGTHYRFTQPQMVEREEQPSWSYDTAAHEAAVINNAIVISDTVSEPMHVTCVVCDHVIDLTNERGQFVHETCLSPSTRVHFRDEDEKLRSAVRTGRSLLEMG